MKRRFHPFFIVILVLMAIGIMTNMMTRPFELIVAIVIFGGVFLLWKYPPARWSKSNRRKPTPSSSAKRSKERRKDVPFRVIQGNKRDDDGPPEKPHTYH
ncbi:hypothetical protein ACFFNY_29295 [Paenibacillus hodogayensis]|uniref:Secreted protein n=1 Tax=Paenibacillus hodogayensis TaxID=279208 RepID=A0ABV5W559_9BACL